MHSGAQCTVHTQMEKQQLHTERIMRERRVHTASQSILYVHTWKPHTQPSTHSPNRSVMHMYVCLYVCKRGVQWFICVVVFFFASHLHCIDGYRFYNSKSYETKPTAKTTDSIAAFAICIIHWLNEPRWRWWRQQSGDTIRNGRHISNDSVCHTLKKGMSERASKRMNHRGRAKLRNTVFRELNMCECI